MVILIKLYLKANFFPVYTALEASTVAEMMKKHNVRQDYFTTSHNSSSVLGKCNVLGKQQETINMDFPVLVTSLNQLKPEQQSRAALTRLQ